MIETEIEFFDYVRNSTLLYLPMVVHDSGDYLVHVEAYPDKKIIRAFLERDAISTYVVSKGPSFRYATVQYGTMVRKLSKTYDDSKVPVRLILMCYSKEDKILEVEVLWNSFCS
jgi:hypothetical protein